MTRSSKYISSIEEVLFDVPDPESQVVHGQIKPTTQIRNIRLRSPKDRRTKTSGMSEYLSNLAPNGVTAFTGQGWIYGTIKKDNRWGNRTGFVQFSNTENELASEKPARRDDFFRGPGISEQTCSLASDEIPLEDLLPACQGVHDPRYESQLVTAPMHFIANRLYGNGWSSVQSGKPSDISKEDVQLLLSDLHTDHHSMFKSFAKPKSVEDQITTMITLKGRADQLRRGRHGLSESQIRSQVAQSLADQSKSQYCEGSLDDWLPCIAADAKARMDLLDSEELYTFKQCQDGYPLLTEVIQGILPRMTPEQTSKLQSVIAPYRHEKEMMGLASRCYAYGLDPKRSPEEREQATSNALEEYKVFSDEELSELAEALTLSAKMSSSGTRTLSDGSEINASYGLFLTGIEGDESVACLIQAEPTGKLSEAGTEFSGEIWVMRPDEGR